MNIPNCMIAGYIEPGDSQRAMDLFKARGYTGVDVKPSSSMPGLLIVYGYITVSDEVVSQAEQVVSAKIK